MYRNKSKKTKKKQPNYSKLPIITKTKQNQVEKEEAEDEYEGIEDMIEDDDLSFLKQLSNSKSYQILHENQSSRKPRRNKNKGVINDELEQIYEAEQKGVLPVHRKRKLPIKTKDGRVVQVFEEEPFEKLSKFEDEEEEGEESDVDEGVFSHDEESKEEPSTVTVAQLLKNRDKVLEEKRTLVGSLSASLLENPEEKVHNLRSLLGIVDETALEVHTTVKKLAIVSLLEVFKDILPTYQLKLQGIDGVKVKKDTLKLHKYEEQLLHYYKKYLQKLEKHCMLLLRRKTTGKHVQHNQDTDLAILTLRCMCDLLKNNLYFNYAENIAEVIAPFLSHAMPSVRAIANETCTTIFTEDKKGEITLKVLQVINKYLKTHSDVQSDMLQVLLSLRLKGVNLDEEQQNKLKEKKLQKHKSRVLQLSKKEKKRQKRLDALDKELFETKAEENRQAKHRNITEQIKIVFGIYFKILKSLPNPKILSLCLEGLSKFASCINIEYYIDVINVLAHLLKGDDDDYTPLQFSERQHCIQTVFAMLSAEASTLNIDPHRFYNHFYKDLLQLHAGKTHRVCPTVLEIFTNALIKRQKKMTLKSRIGFLKKIATLTLQLPHNSALACLSIMRSMQQTTRALDILIDLESNVGEGPFMADVDNPEFSNASSSAIYEMALLSKSYHPDVAKYAQYVATGSSLDTHLSHELTGPTPQQLYDNYDIATVAFKPAVPFPRKINENRGGPYRLNNSQFLRWCVALANNKQE